VTSARAWVLLTAGIALVLGSAVPWHQGLRDAARQTVAVEVDLDPRIPDQSRQITLASGARARLVMALTVHVPEDLETSSEPPSVRYRFPFEYRITDLSGHTLAGSALAIDPHGAPRVEKAHAVSVLESAVRRLPEGYEVEVTAVLPAFELLESPEVVLTAELGQDQRYGATLEAVTVRLEHGLTSPLGHLIGGLVMFLFGLIAAVMGFTARLSAAQPAGQSAPTTAQEDVAALRRQARLCHLAGLCAYAVPLGVLVPLALWTRTRRRHPYLDQQGREAINFQLSVLVYIALSLGLVLVVVGLVLVPLLLVFHLTTTIAAARAAGRGEAWRYPITLRFVR